MFVFGLGLVSALVYTSVQPSPGCLKTPDTTRHYSFPLGRTVRRNLTVTDRNNFTATRHFWIHRPKSFDPTKPLPLMLYLHGQGGRGNSDLPPYVAIAEREGFIVLSAQGLGADQDCGSGWNVGGTGDDSTCTRETWSAYGANATCCYTTCQSLGRCPGGSSTWTSGSAHCGWTTCFEDVDFFKLLFEVVEANACINTRARFVSGGSNGGMMTYYLASTFPTTFAAVAPIYGLPLKGRLDVPQALKNVSLLHIHDRWDTIIPLQGGKSAEGWLYTPFDTVARAWLTIASGPTAKVTETPITTKWDGGDQNLECFEYHASSDTTSDDNIEIEPRKRRVIKCLYDGYHGSWLPNDNGEELTWWFFKQFVPK